MTDRPLHLASPAAPARAANLGLRPPLRGAIAATLAAASVVLSLGPAFGSGPAVAAALGLFAAGATLMLAALRTGYPYASFGFANTVTLLRLALVAVLAAAVVEPRELGPWAVPALALASLGLDGVDGWLARRTGLVSSFGARFDMEVDCILALALALFVLQAGTVGAWVLALGLARYLYWGASAALPWLDGPLPQRRSRKAVCVIQIAALIALASPAVDARLAPWLAAAALVLVGWSFAADIRHLHRIRK